MNNKTDYTQPVSLQAEDPKPEQKILLKVYNRKQARTAAKLNIEFDRVKNTPVTNEKKREFKAFRRELAFKHGSKTGELKKKHIERENGPARDAMIVASLEELFNIDVSSKLTNLINTFEEKGKTNE